MFTRQDKGRWCPECNRKRRVSWDYSRFSFGFDLLHGTLVLLTCGLWLPVPLYYAMRHRYCCVVCGTRCN